MPGFIPDLSVILAFAVAVFVIAITPGPDMALQMSRSINHGFRHGIACGLGAMSGIVVHTILVAFGISVTHWTEVGGKVLGIGRQIGKDPFERIALRLSF